jgi:hypothetical protein
VKNQQYYMPAVLICGIIAGLLSGVPCVNLLMCCFCIQIVLPGMFAVKFVADKANQSIDAGESAIIGVIVGGIAAVLGGTMTAIVSLLFGGANQAQMAQVAQQVPELAPYLQQGASGTVSSAISQLCCFGVMFPLFGALGGLIGSAVFKKDPPGGQPPYGGGGTYNQPAQGGYGQPQGGGYGQPQGGGYEPPQGGGFGQPPSGGGFGT